MSGQVRVGTCSWTDPTMVRAWYPPTVRSAADRLRYYATQFDTVEVDSSFYGVPTPATARLWAERTPPGFVFHVKAFGMLTRHGVRPEGLPAPLRVAHSFELDRYGRIVHPSQALREETFALFHEALAPLRHEEKLGLILMQFPPYFVANENNREYISYSVRLLAPDKVAVEFRHSSWVEPGETPRTLDLLTSLGAAYVCVDEPRMDGPTVLPPLVAVTTDTAYVRFHGRNAAMWNARVSSAAERFKYLYTIDELQEWVEPVRRLQRQTGTTYLMFNNCFADYAPRNAKQMMSLLEAAPREDPAPPLE
ncbi:MAG: DUF72 domain-containing protein [Actinomycetia bacterium]|nr:DUF72 domain-containing protein [Actinomycetes bacterium]